MGRLKKPTPMFFSAKIRSSCSFIAVTSILLAASCSTWLRTEFSAPTSFSSTKRCEFFKPKDETDKTKTDKMIIYLPLFPFRLVAPAPENRSCKNKLEKRGLTANPRSRSKVWIFSFSFSASVNEVSICDKVARSSNSCFWKLSALLSSSSI